MASPASRRQPPEANAPRAAFRARLGLTDPLLVQSLLYLADIAQFDFGTFLGVPLPVLAAVRRERLIRRACGLGGRCPLQVAACTAARPPLVSIRDGDAACPVTALPAFA